MRHGNSGEAGESIEELSKLISALLEEQKQRRGMGGRAAAEAEGEPPPVLGAQPEPEPSGPERVEREPVHTPAAEPQAEGSSPGATPGTAAAETGAGRLRLPSTPQQQPAGAARASMSEGLRLLFGGAAAAPPAAGPSPAPAPASEPAPQPAPAPGPEPSREPGAAPEGSPYFQAFLVETAGRRPPLASGLAGLDELLDGGFHSGLSVVSSRAAWAARSLLENMLWKAATEQKKVVYYHPAGRGQEIWQRLLLTLGHLIGEPLRREQLAARPVSEKTLDEVRRLDALFTATVLPHLSLRELRPAGPLPLVSLLREIDEALPLETGPPAGTSLSTGSGLPGLVLIDGFAALSLLPGLRDPGDVAGLLLELDGLLRRRRVAGLLLWERRRRPDDERQVLAGQVVALRPAGRFGRGGLLRLQVRVGGQWGGRRATLAWDPASALLTDLEQQP